MVANIMVDLSIFMVMVSAAPVIPGAINIFHIQKSIRNHHLIMLSLPGYFGMSKCL